MVDKSPYKLGCFKNTSGYKSAAFDKNLEAV
jgi:hypothetical protein